MHVVISSAVTLISLGIALVMWTVGGKHWPYVILALVATGVGGLMQTKIGDWVRAGMKGLNHLLAGLHIGVSIPLGVLTVILVVYVGYKLAHRDIDSRTVAAVAATVAVGGSIPGVVGLAVSYAFGSIAWLVSEGVALAFGIH